MTGVNEVQCIRCGHMRPENAVCDRCARSASEYVPDASHEFVSANSYCRMIVGWRDGCTRAVMCGRVADHPVHAHGVLRVGMNIKLTQVGVITDMHEGGLGSTVVRLRLPGGEEWLVEPAGYATCEVLDEREPR